MFCMGVVNAVPATGTLASLAVTGWAMTAVSTTGSTRLAATAVKVGWATRVPASWNAAAEENVVGISTCCQLPQPEEQISSRPGEGVSREKFRKTRCGTPVRVASQKRSQSNG
jgi:hypothetical protein